MVYLPRFEKVSCPRRQLVSNVVNSYNIPSGFLLTLSSTDEEFPRLKETLSTNVNGRKMHLNNDDVRHPSLRVSARLVNRIDG